MFKDIAIITGVVLGVFGLVVASIAWWLGRVFKDWDWNTW